MNPSNESDGPERFLRFPPLGERPTRSRATARVLLIDERDHLLLFTDHDPGVPGSSWWTTPGGGIDPGETPVGAAVRELAEETGLIVTADDVAGPLAHRTVRHSYSDVIITQDDTFFGVRTTRFEIDTTGHTEDEKITMTGHRWWPRAELAATSDLSWLADLWGHWDRWVAGRTSEVLELGHAEESTIG